MPLAAALAPQPRRPSDHPPGFPLAEEETLNSSSTEGRGGRTARRPCRSRGAATEAATISIIPDLPWRRKAAPAPSSRLALSDWSRRSSPLLRSQAEFRPYMRLLDLGRYARLTGVVRKRCAVIERTGGNSLVIAPAVHSTAATAMGAAATAAAKSSALRSGFIHG